MKTHPALFLVCLMELLPGPTSQKSSSLPAVKYIFCMHTTIGRIISDPQPEALLWQPHHLLSFPCHCLTQRPCAAFALLCVTKNMVPTGVVWWDWLYNEYIFWTLWRNKISDFVVSEMLLVTCARFIFLQVWPSSTSVTSPIFFASSAVRMWPSKSTWTHQISCSHNRFISMFKFHFSRSIWSKNMGLNQNGARFRYM